MTPNEVNQQIILSGVIDTQLGAFENVRLYLIGSRTSLLQLAAIWRIILVSEGKLGGVL